MVKPRRLCRIQTVFGVFFFLLFLILSQNASAQSTISGIIYDKQRNPLSDIDIELLNDYHQSIQRAKSDPSGRYQFTGLADGRYSVRVFAFRYDLEDQTQDQEINTQNIRGGFGSAYLVLDFYLFPRKGGLAESELGVLFAQEIPPDAKNLYEKGVEHLSKKRTTEGITALNDAIQIFPTYFLALHRIGKELYFLQRYEDAARFLYKAVEVNPKSGASFYYLGSAFMKLGKDFNKAALASLNQANVLVPNVMQVLWALGKAERAEGKFVDAEKHLLQAKKVSGGGVPEIHKELVELYSNDMKKYKEAADELELFMKASKMNEEDSKAYKKKIAELREKAKS